MSITAQDIQQQGFDHAMRGYNIDQVDEFLELVAREVDLLNQENDSLRAQAQEASSEEPAEDTAPQAPVATEVNEEAQRRVKQAEANAAAATEQTRIVAAQLKAAQDELAAANEKIAQLKGQIAEKGNEEATISNAFISAQRAADAMMQEAKSSADALKEEARAEGERIYRESEAKARDFIREALAKKQQIVDETEALSESCSKFRSQYRALVEHFTGEAERKFTELDLNSVPEVSVSESLPTSTITPAKEEPSAAAIADNDELIEEID